MVSAASGSSFNNDLIISKESLPNATNCIRKISIVVEETEALHDTQISDVAIADCDVDSPLRRRLNKI